VGRSRGRDEGRQRYVSAKGRLRSALLGHGVWEGRGWCALQRVRKCATSRAVPRAGYRLFEKKDEKADGPSKSEAEVARRRQAGRQVSVGCHLVRVQRLHQYSHEEKSLPRTRAGSGRGGVVR